MSSEILWWSLFMLISVTFSSKPNIFFILADDFGWAEVGFHRTKQDSEVVTPNIDKLATNGLELTRHYVHFVCSPTRSSFQSGRYPVHVNYNNHGPQYDIAGITINMTTIGNRMKQGGYSTHMVGKYDIGMATPQQAPLGRGYDTSLIYFNHDNDYWKQTKYNCNNIDIVDLWDTNKPSTQNGTNYEETIFANRIYDLIDNEFNEKQAFFMVYTPHISHAPLQIPQHFLKDFNFSDDEYLCSSFKDVSGSSYIYPGYPPNVTDYKCRSILHAMVSYLDEIIGNITNKLKTNNLWNNTLLIFTSDNGGSLKLSANAGNNYPLRGGKFTEFEGGIRATTFVSGGYLPSSRNGQIENGMISICDWYVTFCQEFAGIIDCNDTNAINNGLPNVDGLNVWKLISGLNKTSPRTEIPISENGLIQNEYKYLVGNIGYASWTSETFPNTSSMQHPVEGTILNCSNGCLFDVVNDMTEHIDIAKENTQIVKSMANRLDELKKGFFVNNITGTYSCPKYVNNSDCPCWMALNKYNGFWGPYQDVAI